MKKHPLYATLAGFSMIAVGLCLCRYAYTPLIPSLIDEHWVTKAGAGYLGGFNCLGYLIGCLGALFLPAYLSVRLLLRLSLVIAVGGLVMCAWDLGFVWLALGRAATGLGGASLVVHTPSVALPHVPENWKKVASGVIFTGAGGSIMLVSLLVPFFLSQSVMWGWLFEAALALVAAVIAWPLARSAAAQPNHNRARPEPLTRGLAGSLFLLGVAYFLAAIGITPHTLFLTDYLHRDLGVTAAQSSMLFSLIGAGSLLGALASGVIARTFGTSLSLLANYLLGAVAVAMVLFTTSVTVVSVSAFIIGFFLLCCVALSSVRTGELSGSGRHPHYWGILTLGFGVGLATGSYGLSGLLSLGMDYYATFLVAQGVLIVALLLAGWLFLRRHQAVGS